MKENLEYKKQKKKQKHLLKELQSAEQGEYSVMDNWEAIDMKKQLHPIGYYINDREEMIRQVFTVIQGEKLKKMLPPILKDVDLDELKADCLIHLVGMSSKRIKAILEGRELDVSSDESDSDIESNNCIDKSLGSMKKKKSVSTRSSATISYNGQTVEDGCSVISDDMLEIGLSNSELCDDYFESNDDSKSPKRKRKKLNQINLKKPNQEVVSCTTDNLIDSLEMDNKKSCSSSKDSQKEVKSGDGENKGKTLLEILELEMRARAIRALLKRDDSPSAVSNSLSQNKLNDNDNSNTKQTLLSSDIIDLTSVNDCGELKAANDGESLNTINKAIKSKNDDCSGSVNVASDNKHTISDDNCKEKEGCNFEQEGRNQQNMQLSESKNKEQIYLVSSDEENTIRHKSDDKAPMNVESVCDKSLSLPRDSTDNDNERVSFSSNSTNDDAASSWAQRWLEKKRVDVKRLVSTSKMCTSIRNKMKKSKLNQSKTLTNEGISQSVFSEFKGSIEEYNRLLKNPSTKEGLEQSCMETSDKDVNSFDAVDKAETAEEKDSYNSVSKEVEFIERTIGINVNGETVQDISQ